MTGVFDGRRAVVLGAGVAGRAAAAALVAEGARVTLTDAAEADDLGDMGDLRAIGVDVRLGGQRREDFDGADLVVTSPGIAPTAPVFAWASERGLEMLRPDLTSLKQDFADTHRSVLVQEKATPLPVLSAGRHPQPNPGRLGAPTPQTPYSL